MLIVKGLRLAFMAVKFFINNQLTRGLLNIGKECGRKTVYGMNQNLRVAITESEHL